MPLTTDQIIAALDTFEADEGYDENQFRRYRTWARQVRLWIPLSPSVDRSESLLVDSVAVNQSS